MKTTSKFAIAGIGIVSFFSLLVAFAPEVSTKCKDHQNLATKELGSMLSLFYQLNNNPAKVLDNSKVEKANYFNSHTATLLNDMKSVCGERQDILWTQANMPLLTEVQKEIKTFNAIKQTVLQQQGQ